MAKGNFQPSLAFVLKYEGGFVNDKDDPGGATNKGITLATFRDYWQNQNLSVDDLRNISDTTVANIYGRYWRQVQGEALNLGMDLQVFDFAVNAGPITAIRRLQIILGVVVDGALGPKTLAAANAYDWPALMSAYRMSRRVYYSGLPGFAKFGKGWLARTDACYQTGVNMLKPKS